MQYIILLNAILINDLNYLATNFYWKNHRYHKSKTETRHVSTGVP